MFTTGSIVSVFAFTGGVMGGLHAFSGVILGTVGNDANICIEVESKRLVPTGTMDSVFQFLGLTSALLRLAFRRLVPLIVGLALAIRHLFRPFERYIVLFCFLLETLVRFRL